MYNEKLIMDERNLFFTIKRMANEILENIDNLENVSIIGLQTKGVFLAKRIIKEIEIMENFLVSFGTIDISFYRDDFYKKPDNFTLKETKLFFDVNNRQIFLIDDVIYTGRSIRAAIDCLIDFGRPKNIKLAVLIDRGNRELPIQPDIIGKKFETRQKNEIINVNLKEIEGFDSVVIGEI